MAEIQLVRMPNIEITDAERQAARRVIFGHVDGVGEKNQARWRRFWNRLLRMEAGEIQSVQTLMQRSGPFHRRHMAIEQAVFNAQERFDDFEQFRYWLKVGAAWVTWAAGPNGGVVPIPRSISYANADENEFREYHAAVIGFLRGPHAAPFLWRHLGQKADDMMDSILRGFDE